MSHLFQNLRIRLKNLLIWLWKQDGTPGQRARGLAVGIFSGCLPLFGFQTAVGLALANVFRGNYILAATATWISNPITYIPIYWFNYQIGCNILGHCLNFKNFHQFSPEDLWDQGWIFSSRLLLGSITVGFILAFLMGIISYNLMIKTSKWNAFFDFKRN